MTLYLVFSISLIPLQQTRLGDFQPKPLHLAGVFFALRHLLICVLSMYYIFFPLLSKCRIQWLYNMYFEKITSPVYFDLFVDF